MILLDENNENLPERSLGRWNCVGVALEYLLPKNVKLGCLILEAK